MLATKFASSSKAHTTHALRARISQRPERRSEEVCEANGRNCVPGSDLIVVLLTPLIGKSLRQQEDCTSSGTVVCAVLSQIIPCCRLQIVTKSMANRQGSWCQCKQIAGSRTSMYMVRARVSFL